jgi:hypothetical protein
MIDAGIGVSAPKRRHLVGNFGGVIAFVEAFAPKFNRNLVKFNVTTLQANKQSQNQSENYLPDQDLLLKIISDIHKAQYWLKPSKLWRVSGDIPFGRIGVPLHPLHIHTIGSE